MSGAVVADRGAMRIDVVRTRTPMEALISWAMGGFKSGSGVQRCNGCFAYRCTYRCTLFASRVSGLDSKCNGATANWHSLVCVRACACAHKGCVPLHRCTVAFLLYLLDRIKEKTATVGATLAMIGVALCGLIRCGLDQVPQNNKQLGFSA